MQPNLHLAHTSDVLLTWAVFMYAFAMFGYAAEFAAGRRAEVRGGGAEAVKQGTRRAELVGRGAVVLTVIGWCCHLSSVITRGVAVHRVPWGNMYEFSCMVTLVAVSIYLFLIFQPRVRAAVTGKRRSTESVRSLGAFVMAPVVLYLGLAGTVLYAAPGPLVPALNSYWIKIHVVAAITATGSFMVSGVVTVLYLLKERYERGKPPLHVSLMARLRSPMNPEQVSLGPGTAAAIELTSARGGLMRALPPAAALDRLAYRIITFAFPVWTFAIIAGAIWAEQAWSRYWGWDPKETWSFITWLGYAAYLHARATAGWRGRRAATLSLIAFGCLMVDYYVVNTVITGLHSYAGIS
ncbi:MAG TPA: c-type cytochrome biogenesis protein CcsB [Mycobacteriales bacterium]|jgi:cytochrome c-type biogenesis protein CcsB|nr:c-type cytochrome biogenesis protein CcsB [Mycobacteriales bacterium]